MSAVADRLSVPPPKRLASTVVNSFAAALGGGVAALCIAWVGGIVTGVELKLELNPIVERLEAVEKVSASSVEAQTKANVALEALVKQLEDENLARRSDREMLILEMGNRVWLQAAYAVTADPKKRRLGERIGEAVRNNFEQRVLRGEDPKIAAERAIGSARLQDR